MNRYRYFWKISQLASLEQKTTDGWEGFGTALFPTNTGYSSQQSGSQGAGQEGAGEAEWEFPPYLLCSCVKIFQATRLSAQCHTHTRNVVSICLILEPDVRGIYKAGKHGQKKLINWGERATSVSWKNIKYRVDKSAFRNGSLKILMSSMYATVANCPKKGNRENVTNADNRLDSYWKGLHKSTLPTHCSFGFWECLSEWNRTTLPITLLP